jgi:protein FAM50
MASYVGSTHDGERASKLAKKREAEKEEFNKQKEKMNASSQVGLKSVDSMFQESVSVSEQRFKAATVGLSTIDDFRRKRLMAEEIHQEKERRQAKAKKKLKKEMAKERQKKMGALTFDAEDEMAPEDEYDTFKKRKLAKDPSAETFFLRDKDRDAEDDALKEKLAAEWDEQQGIIKKEEIEITYSYWDGSGHRRVITVTKGTTVERFLEQVRRQIAEAFHELRGISSENLMYIKEDLIIPHHYSFYDLIVSKARGKSGPLFHFDVRDDVRINMDVRVEKDESHAGKIITRSYYERNQHIFPVNRWEVYDPNKSWEQYTVKDRPDIK